MKGTILILAIVAMAGVGYASGMENLSRQTAQKTNEAMAEREHELISAQEFDIETFIANPDRPIGKAAPEWMKVAPESWKHETLNTTQIIDLLTRCKEFLRDGDRDMRQTMRQTVHTTSEYRPLTRKGVIEGEIKSYQEELERLERETQLLRDIEAALKALQ